MSSDSPSDPWTRGDAWMLLAMSGFAALLALVGLGSKEFWLDEADTWLVAYDGLGHLISVVGAWDINSVPYYLFTWLWMRGGDAEAWLRLPSVVAGAAAVPVVAELGRRLFDRRVGLVAALLLATSGSFLIHTQEARPYPFMVLLGAASSILFLRAVRLGTVRSWVWYAVGTAALVSLHLFGGLVVAGHLAWLLVTQPISRLRRECGLFVALGMIAAIAVPLAVAVRMQASGYRGSDYLGAPWSPGTYLPIARFWAGGSRPAIALLLVPSAAVVWQLWRHRRARNVRPTASEWFVVLGVAVPLAAMAIASVDQNLLLARYLIVCVPCVTIFAARGLQMLPIRPAGLLLILLVAGSLNAAVTWHRSGPIDHVGELTAHLSGVMAAGDQLVLLNDYDRVGVNYYSRHIPADELPTLVNPEELDPPGWRGELVVADPADLLGQSARTWVVAVVGEDGIVASHREVIEEWADAGHEPAETVVLSDRALLRFDGQPLS